MPIIITAQKAADLITDGATIMTGGFGGCGSAHKVFDLLAKKGTNNLTVISNDPSLHNGPDGSRYYGLAKLIHNRQVKCLIASHVGLNPEVSQQVADGDLELILLPQGTLAEMIRAGGSGLGGVLTPTGIGTLVEKSPFVHSKMTIQDRDYLLMLPLRAEIALINGHKIDRFGNIWYRGTTRNFNVVMAMAADMVIAEADMMVEPGEIEPENVMTSGVLVDYIVDGGK